jgi:DNA-binding response OmpR family regulator
MKKVLIVDDEVKITAIVRRYLEKHGVEVDVRHNVLESHSIVMCKRFDLIIIDFNMPSYKGTHLIDTLKLTDSNDKTPVVVMSAFLDTEVRAEFQNRGVKEFIEKPVRMDQFYNKVGRYLELNVA